MAVCCLPWVYLHQTWGFCKAWSALYDYRISSDNSRGRLFEEGDYFKYFSQEVVPYIFCFIIPNNKGKSEIREHYHRKNCKKRYFCNHPVVKTNLHKRDHEI